MIEPKSRFELKTFNFNTKLNCHLFQKLKLVKNDKFNHLIDIFQMKRTWQTRPPRTRQEGGFGVEPVTWHERINRLDLLRGLLGKPRSLSVGPEVC
jgi:hypothetical protein